MNDSILGPFSQEELAKATLGPFATGPMQAATSPTAGTTDPRGYQGEKTVLDALGVTPAEFRSLLDANPEVRDFLTQPEAEALYAYLRGSEKYDIHVLNNLFAELTAGLKARQVPSARSVRESTPGRAKPNPHSPGWPIAGAAPETPGWIAPEGPAEPGEPQPPSAWWLEGKG